MSRPRVLIEQWLPIDQIGAECMRERGASSALPPLYFLHVWWARKPLTVSRATILASLLPAYPTGDEDDRTWPKELLKRFPTFDTYKQWYLKLIGIQGDPAASRKIIDWAKIQGLKLTPAIIGKLPKEWKEGLPNDMGISIPYGYPRAFTYNPNEEQLETLYDLLEWTWGTREITFCDPMSGGGSIPFEALRFGLTVHANELNPVASVILKATLDYPARFGPSLVDDIRKYGNIWSERVRKRLESFYPLSSQNENIFCYIWARTVACPTTGKPVPLSPTWWLRKGSSPIAVRLRADSRDQRCTFVVVHGTQECLKEDPDKGTINRGTGKSPWTGDAIDGEYIKREAQAGRMGQQLYAVGIKTSGELTFRQPTEEDELAAESAVKALNGASSRWAQEGLLPDEELAEHSNYDRGHRLYGMKTWVDLFSPRQLFSQMVFLDELRHVAQLLSQDLPTPRANAVHTYLAIAFDKCVDYNSRLIHWDPTRTKVCNGFAQHNYSIIWNPAEFDACRNLLPWAMDQILDAYNGIQKLSHPPMGLPTFAKRTHPLDRLQVVRGTAQSLTDLKDGTVRCICVDPPYVESVQIAELSDMFFVWLKRTLSPVDPTLLSGTLLTPKDEEVIANPARFAFSGRKRKQLSEKDFQVKLCAAFKEMSRVLSDDGVLSVMFTHKRIDAWDGLCTALIDAGFRVGTSWPVHTEHQASLHQAKSNSATSTILLVCQKRERSSEPVWWEDLKGTVRSVARKRAAEFEKQGIRGVDLYISTFGPVLSIISENWPVLTSETDPKTGEPLPLKPGDALDLARAEVVNLRKQGLLLGRSVEFDPFTDWYLMAWDAFRAQEFPADEAVKLALALGLDLEQDVIRDKKLVAKKSGKVVICKPSDRRKKNMVDDEAESFPHLIDALHTAMMIYDEEGSKACQVFVDRQGLRNDSRIKSLVQATMEAIPKTRGKDGKFLRPEMTTLDALRALFWEDLPAPKEEEPPKIDPQRGLFGMEADDSDEEDEEEPEEEEVDE